MIRHSDAEHVQTADPLRGSYLQVREFTERLCEPLQTEDFVVQSMEEASPVKWHLAHTTWFFETFVLLPHDRTYSAFHSDFTFLFNSYYARVGRRFLRTNRGLVTRPTVRQVMEYRNHVNERLLRLLEDAEGKLRKDVSPLVEIGLHHEQQHQELILTDLKHAFSLNPLKPVYLPGPSAEEGSSLVPEPGWTSYEEGLYWIGHHGEDFCFDNEKPRHRRFLESFELADRPVTNAEYLEFVKDGGYERETLWLSEGFQWVTKDGWKAPLYWELRDGEWWQFTVHGPLPLRPAEPVCHVSHFEADAYARWAGVRLPTEAEWEVAAGDRPVEGNFAESGRFHPRPASPRSAEAPSRLFGDVWEWTASPYVGYPGFQPSADALGEYNGKFMSNQMVLRGGSCATPRSHVRATYRNFFPSPARWQFTGIRLAR